jgi:hypothetical protein
MVASFLLFECLVEINGTEAVISDNMRWLSRRSQQRRPRCAARSAEACNKAGNELHDENGESIALKKKALETP